MPATRDDRRDFLDWLRVIAIFALLFFHTGMIFVGWGWHVVNAQTIPSVQWPMEVAHHLRMPLIFLIAGAALWFASQQRTAWQVFRERTWRLMLPLLVGLFVLVPPQIYYERLFRGEWTGGYPKFFFTRVLQLHLYPQGDFGWHHLWFILYLYIYVLALLPALFWWKQHAPKLQLRPGWWLYALALPIACNEAFVGPLFPQTYYLTNDWFAFIHYLLLTVFGCVIASIPGTWQWISERRWYSLAGVLATIVLEGLLRRGGAAPHGSSTSEFLAGSVTWLAVLAFLGYGYRYLSFSNPLLRWAREASYPIYVVHQTFTVVVGYYVVQTSWNPWIKFVVILSATLFGSVGIYQACISRFAVLRFAFGMRAPREAPAATAAAPVPRTPVLPH